LYRVIEKVQQDPTLVWLWVNPVTTNATSQKVLIPNTSPLRMYLSVDSDASVKITCPVVYSDTGISADDRVKGNPAGFSIILGSSATADSSLIVAQLIEQLGGIGYSSETDNLKMINEQVQNVNQNVTDSKAELFDAIGTPLQADDYTAPDNTTIGEIKTKVDTLNNYDDTSLQTKVDTANTKITALGTPLQAVDYTAPDNTTINEIKTKVDTLENTDITTLATEATLNKVKANTNLIPATL
jgi:hypothetical protein